MKVWWYKGIRTKGGVKVFICTNSTGLDRIRLPPRLDIYNHSPTGFEWGYHGSGPAQLALALLAHCLGDDELALRCHQQFKSAVVACLPSAGWEISEQQIRDAVAVIEREAS